MTNRTGRRAARSSRRRGAGHGRACGSFSAEPVGGDGAAELNPDGSLTWEVGTVTEGSVDEPTQAVLIVESVADTLAQDPPTGVEGPCRRQPPLRASGIEAIATARGPKVIPPNATYETARYGDRPYPVVPVDFFDRDHLDSNSGTELDEVLNDPAKPGSTFNLFQEMSYGQTVPQRRRPSQRHRHSLVGWR